VAIQEGVLGPDHPDLAKTLDNYGSLLRKLGRSAQARALEKRAVEIRTRHAWQQP
jgi:hypothetical protein